MRATSSGDATTARRVSDRAERVVAAAGAHRLTRRADAVRAPLAERVLHQPVLARVVGDDRERPPGARRSRSAGSARANPASSSLTAMRTAWNSRAKSGGPVRAPRRAADRADEVVARREGTVARRRTISRARRPARGSSPYSRKMRASSSSSRVAEQLRGARRGASRAHAHVERRALPEGEAARRVVDLMRGDAKVEQDAVEAKVGDGGDGVDRGVVSLDRRRSGRARRRRRVRARLRERVRVAIDADDRARRRLEQRRRVPAAAERAVEDERGAAEQRRPPRRRAPENGSRCPRLRSLVEAWRARDHTTSSSRETHHALHAHAAARSHRHDPNARSSAPDLHRARRARRPPRPAARRVLGAAARARGGRAGHLGGGRRHRISPPRRPIAARTW